ncbi:Polyadenylate-binding protein RBP47 [Camellia lanceoleosa]|uniref:Polyadenylate-binding protein RBP47 n=1 Tax=Camellia lanceoleosa TaxID=1840588 RepID=A0ACC0FND1_9ERIC|nr:Polyadenylate-binding protein RBP47 [Camellia lanceoleosa]
MFDMLACMFSSWITCHGPLARASAEEAIQRMQGTMIGQQAVHLSWGRSPTAKQDCLYERFSQKNLSFPTVALNLMLYVKARKDIIEVHDFHKGITWCLESASKSKSMEQHLL